MGRLFKSLKALAVYLGVHFTVGLGVSVVCLFLFYTLADNVREQEAIVFFDQELANALHMGATSVTTTFFWIISLIGVPGMLIMTIAVALYYLWRKENWKAYLWLIAYFGGELLNRALKMLFARPRPIFDTPLAFEPDFSFPSGHAMLSMIMLGLLAYSLANHFKEKRIVAILSVFPCVLLIILMGMSRLYLGVHFFSDVLAGFAVGAVWLVTCITAMHIIRKRRDSRRVEAVA